ncbi:MAG TPA: hypothetical protein VFV52_17975, partial [Bacilli bacterium]|nr:hypothetical protein [Bacilli bacterium]
VCKSLKMSEHKPKHTRNALVAFLVGLVGTMVWMIVMNVVSTVYYTAQTGNRDAATEAIANNAWLQGGLYFGMELLLLLIVLFVGTLLRKRSVTNQNPIAS